MLDALIAATSLMVLCAIIVTIDGRAGDELARLATKHAADTGGVAVQLHDGVTHATRSAVELSHVYGPLMTFSGIALVLVLVMVRTK
jgi:hypothetical protein